MVIDADFHFSAQQIQRFRTLGDKMAEFVSLTCPSCGSRLQVTNDLDTFACGYCGNELRVKRGGGVVSLAPMVEGLERVQKSVAGVEVGVDKTASELAIQRLRQDLQSLEVQWNQADGEKSFGLGAGIVGLALGWLAIANDSGWIGPAILVFGIVSLLVFFLSERGKSAQKSEIGAQMKRIAGEIEYHKLKLTSH